MEDALGQAEPVPRIDAIRTARYQRWAARLLMVLIVLQITTLFVIPQRVPIIPLLVFAALIVSGALAVVFAVLLLAATRCHASSLVLCGCLAFFPFINIVVLAFVCRDAMERLQEVGIRSGFFGTRNTEIEPLSRLLGCPGCGYSLYGNTSGRCPECGWEVPRAKKPVPVATPICQKCGYNLTGNTSGRCPECGQALQKPSLICNPKAVGE